MTAQIAAFVDLAVERPNLAPRWWKRMLSEWAGEILRRRALLDTPAPWTEIQRIRRAA